MHQSYRFAIAYFVLFGLLLLASGMVLFFSKIGFTYEAVESYYLGSQALFTTSKSSSAPALEKGTYPSSSKIIRF